MSTVPDAIDAFNSGIPPEERRKYQEIEDHSVKWRFEVVPGFFKQLDPETNDGDFNYFKEHFGRLKPWAEIEADLKQLNKEAPSNVVYKVLLLARHGQGYHNLANLKYGEEEWNRKWLHMFGDDEMTWAPDPELTALGQSQAKDNHRQLALEFQDGLKLPSRWFLSPFRRSLDTLIGTWAGHVLLGDVKPYIMEDFREQLGVHYCDQRSPRRVIAEKYCGQGFVIEDGFEEEDVYFKPDYREKVWEQAIRQDRGFQYVFDHTTKDEDFVSVTSHLGLIRAQLLVLGHREFAMGTGGMIPVMVKAVKEGR